MTKIEVVSGFLGAGKTTFIKKMLKEAYQNEQVVLIENEFGEIGIDGGFLKEAGVEIREMNSGCICCSLVGDFGTSLKEVLSKYSPDRIIIEPSGVGKLSDVMKAVSDVTDGLDIMLNSAVAVVDASKCKLYAKNFGEFFINQIENAGTILLSRTGIVDESKTKQAVEIIRKYNDKAVVITTPWDSLDGKQILDTIENAKDLETELMKEVVENAKHHQHDENCTCGCHEHDHEHEHDHDHCHEHEHEHDHDHCHEHEHEHDHDHCHEHEHEHDHDHCHEHDHEHDHDHCHEHEHDHDHCHEHEHDHDHDHEREHHHDHDENCSCGCHDHDHHHHHADEVFTSWGMQGPKVYTEDEVRDCLDALEDEKRFGFVLRAKGMVPAVNGEWIYFDYVPGEAELRKGAADVTGKICVIGSKLQTDELETLWKGM